MKYLICVIVLLVLALAAGAAHAQRLPVSIQCEALGSDTIGKRICSGLRDALARSPRWREAGPSDVLVPWIHVQSQSIEQTAMSAQSVVFTVGEGGDERYINSCVTYTGRETVNDQVEQIMANFDSVMYERRKK